MDARNGFCEPGCLDFIVMESLMMLYFVERHNTTNTTGR